MAASVLLAALVTLACAAPQSEALRRRVPADPVRVELRAVPSYPQEDHACGPAALAAVLSASGDPVSPESLISQVYSPDRRGTLQASLLSAARRHRRIPYPVADLASLIKEVRAGHPVLVLQNLGLRWIPFWHYAVVVGFDLEREILWLHSGAKRRTIESLPLFERTWARAGAWARVVLAPDELPASGDEAGALEAIAALEASEQPESAARAYRAAIARWPESLGAWMGLGNSRYALGDRRAALAAFRSATELHPRSGAAFNNLAHVLAELGETQEALEAARRAVRLGGSGRSVYRETLREIRNVAPASSSPGR